MVSPVLGLRIVSASPAPLAKPDPISISVCMFRLLKSLPGRGFAAPRLFA
jgi:hypothetical protein